MIKTVIRINKDMVLVFDENGDELPKYQGYYQDVRDRILSDAQTNAVFKYWFGHAKKPDTVAMECW
jgi:hypothetical protein